MIQVKAHKRKGRIVKSHSRNRSAANKIARTYGDPYAMDNFDSSISNPKTWRKRAQLKAGAEEAKTGNSMKNWFYKKQK